MEPGKLYVIATPIGNMGDITFRAVETLGMCDIVFCEDTRETGKILNAHSLKIQMRPLNEHAGKGAVASAVRVILEGKNAAYITDCGTPGISDPGGKFVSEARRAGITIVPIPGASALASILSVCGYPTKRVLFAGFLSKKDGRRRRELESFRGLGAVVVIYESPYRIKKLIAAAAQVFPNAGMLIGREMTKRFEEFIEGTAAELNADPARIKEKGEFTVAINLTEWKPAEESGD